MESGTGHQAIKVEDDVFAGHTFVIEAYAVGVEKILSVNFVPCVIEETLTMESEDFVGTGQMGVGGAGQVDFGEAVFGPDYFDAVKPDVGVAIGEDMREGFGVEFVIGVDEGDVIAGSDFEGGVAGAGKTAVRREMENLGGGGESVNVLVEPCGRGVGGAVVDGDDFVLPAGVVLRGAINAG